MYIIFIVSLYYQKDQTRGYLACNNLAAVYLSLIISKTVGYTAV